MLKILLTILTTSFLTCKAAGAVSLECAEGLWDALPLGMDAEWLGSVYETHVCASPRGEDPYKSWHD